MVYRAIACLAVLTCVTAGGAWSQGIEVTNYAGGETIHYPVPMLRGTVEGATEITVANLSSDRDTRELEGIVHGGRFKVLAELVPGENELVIRSGDAEAKLTLTYSPQTNPYVVRVIYVTDSSGATEYQTPLEDDEQDFEGKLGTAMKLLQTFTAESLNDLGLGRQTFNLELDDEGRVKVHVMKGDRSMAEYHELDGGQLYGALYGEVSRKLPHPSSRNLVIPAFTRFDPETQKVYAHTALGGGNQALFGGGDLFTWPDSLAEAQGAFMDATPVDPTQILSDSVGRHTFWANASTCIGAALHELGHTFGLPHSSDPHCIMTRGIDRLNRFFTLVDPPHARRAEEYEFADDEVGYWAPVSAEALVPNRYFALDDREWDDENLTGFRLDAESKAVVVESPHGIRYLGVNRYGDGGTNSVYHVPIEQRGRPPTKVSVSVVDIGARIGSPNVSLTAIDSQGNSSGTRVTELLNGPYVTAWRFSSLTNPWPNADAFPEADVAAVEASAAKADMAQSSGSYVDFNRLCPTERKQNVAGYAYRVIRSPQARNVLLHTGSDDALRVWVNGEVVTKALALRGAAPDADTSPVELQPGENRLLVEVSQAGGGWGLYLRLADEDGTRLELTDEGELRAVDASLTEEIMALLRGPFVRKWRFAPDTKPWTDRAQFVNLSRGDLKAIQDSALADDLTEVDAGAQVVDLLKHFAEGPQSNVAGYAARVIRCEGETKVKMFTGSDDALRVWLNGEVVTEALEMRGAQPDSDETELVLAAGENVLLVEVSQGAGDWGLVMRFEGAEGRHLVLADDGHLVGK